MGDDVQEHISPVLSPTATRQVIRIRIGRPKELTTNTSTLIFGILCLAATELYDNSSVYARRILAPHLSARYSYYPKKDNVIATCLLMIHGILASTGGDALSRDDRQRSSSASTASMP